MRSLVTLLLIALPAAAQYDDLLTSTKNQWNVPAIAVAVVQDDKVVYLKAIGVKELGKPDPVTPDTLFEIASTTKAFTTTAMAMLVDDKKLSWDDPVRKHLEYFHLADPYADATVTLRDLVSHRTGLSRHDEIWDYDPPASREQVIRSVATVKLSKPLRTTYQYNNIMFSTAGEAVAAAAKMPCEDFVRTRIFLPLGMTHTRVSAADFRSADHAVGHSYDSKTATLTPHEFVDYNNIAPAGAMSYSTVDVGRAIAAALSNAVSA